MNEKGVLGDKILRQAVSRALNRDIYCKVLLEGGATPEKPNSTNIRFWF